MAKKQTKEPMEAPAQEVAPETPKRKLTLTEQIEVMKKKKGGDAKRSESAGS